MVRSAHQKITAIEEIVYGSQFPRGRGDYYTTEGHTEEYQGQSGGRRSKGKAWESLYLGFRSKGKVKEGNRLRIGLSEPFQ